MKAAPARPLVAAALGAFALLAASCAHTQVPERDRLHVSLRYTNQSRELATSLFVAPFFRDTSRRLLTLEPPAEVELLVTPKGRPIAPGEAEEILPAGTRVRVVAVEFPTRWASVSRPLLTPRDRPWVELAVEGRPASPTFVLVLRPDLASEDEVVKEVDRWLTSGAVSAEVRSMSAADQLLVRTKTLAPGTTRRALELALGTPALRRIHGDGEHVVEEWSWNGGHGRSTAHLKDGVVERVELPKKPGPDAARADG